MEIDLESLKNPNKFKTLLAIGLIGTTALAACNSPAEAKPQQPITSTTTELMPPPPLAPPSPIETLPVSTELENAWSEIASERQGNIDIAVFDAHTGQTAHYSKTGERIKTASIVKLSILERLAMLDPLWVEQNKMYIKPMITESSNAIASTLWNKVGGASGMQEFYNHIGANSTIAGAGGSWGGTATTALNELLVVNNAVYPNATLLPESRAIITDFMHQVVPGQRWGVTAGVPADVSVGNKNGWYADRCNSIGHVSGQGVDYTIAVLTDGNLDKNSECIYGRETIGLLSAATWQIMYRAQHR